MNIINRLAVICCSAVFFIACKKNDANNNNDTRTKAQLLVAGKWQISAATIATTYLGRDTIYNLYNSISECDKDDLLVFVAGGTGAVDENGNKCTHNQQVENFTWALLENDTKLTQTFYKADTTDLIEITATQLKVGRSDTASLTVYTYKNINRAQ